VEFLTKEYGEIELITDEDEELVEVSESDWYRSLRGSISPAENLRLYRELHGLTQEELGKRLGHFTRQNISNIENGHRAISKDMAVALAELFDVSVEKFL
jgi:DNA-binding XRE family transcriptional regulator